MRVLRIFVVMTVLVAALATPAAAIDGTPIVGAVLGDHWRELPPADGECPGLGAGGWRFFSSGEGRVSQLGRVSYDLVQCTDETGSVGTIVFTARNGDTLTIAQEVSSKMYFSDPMGMGPPDGFTLRGTWTVVDGSGRFADADIGFVVDNEVAGKLVLDVGVGTGRFADAGGSGRIYGIGDVDVPVADGKRFYGVPDEKVLFTVVGRIHLPDDD